MNASKYVVLNDGQFMWPASREAVLAYDGDPMSDDGCATAGRVPDELLPQIGGGVGTKECIALCQQLIAEGADEIHAPHI